MKIGLVLLPMFDVTLPYLGIEYIKQALIKELGSLAKSQTQEEIKAAQHEAALIENEIAEIEREDEAADINEILESNQK